MSNTTDTKTTKFKPAKLFHAVVLAGAALVNCPGTPAEDMIRTGNVVTDRVESPAVMAPGTCPPGSERPFPPCYWIK